MAFLLREPGGTRVGDVLGEAVMSSVSLAEVLTRSLDRNADLVWVQAQLGVLPLDVATFDWEDAMRVAALQPSTRHLGLTLGDRCCLALGLRLGLPVLTTDRAWAGLDV